MTLNHFFSFFLIYGGEAFSKKKGLSDFFFFNGYRHFSTRFCKQLK